MNSLLQPVLDDHLHGLGRLRVWSLIVTILGDTVEIRDKTMPTARLSALLERMGVSTAAQRTALSRLVKDGWIERVKSGNDGRASAYQFTATGRAAFVPASRLVYAHPRAGDPDHWLICVSDAPRGVPVAPGVGIWPADFAPAKRGLTMVGHLAEVPESKRDQVVGEDHAAEVMALDMLLRFLGQTFAPDDDLDALAARMVLIHRWRRYVLRFPEIPRAMAPDDWPGHLLRKRVALAYWSLAAASDRWLDGTPEGLGRLGAPYGPYWERFGNKK